MRHKKTKKQNKHTLKQALFISIIAVLGLAILGLSSAASTTISIEAEGGTPSNVDRVPDSLASGGTYVRFRSATTNPPPSGQVTSGKKCYVILSGAGQNSFGQPEIVNLSGQGFNVLTPPKMNDINVFGSGAFWVYDGPADYRQSPETGEDIFQLERNRLNQYITQNNCGPVHIEGGSNGGGFAAKLYCRGETFGNKVWGYTFVDPVWDRGVINCRPSPNITHKVAAHSQWLKRLADNAPENRCDRVDEINVGDIIPGFPISGEWYCHDNRTVSEATWEAETGINSRLTGVAHARFELAPDWAPWTTREVLYCDWTRDIGQQPPQTCNWTWNHPWNRGG